MAGDNGEELLHHTLTEILTRTTNFDIIEKSFNYNKNVPVKTPLAIIIKIHPEAVAEFDGLSFLGIRV